MAMYYDAKPSMTDGDNIFESKPHQGASGSSQAAKYDFERAKLKFDRSTGKGASSSAAASSRSSTKGSAAASKRNSGDCSLLEKKSYNEAVQMFDENLKRNGNKPEGGANYMKTSLNLDGLKVSDDEVSNDGYRMIVEVHSFV